MKSCDKLRFNDSTPLYRGEDMAFLDEWIGSLGSKMAGMINASVSGNVSRVHASRRFHGEQSLAELAQDASCGQVTLRDLARRFISGIYAQLRKIGDLVGAGFALYPFKSLGFLCSPIGKCVKLFLSVIAKVIFLLGGLMRDLAKWAVCQTFGDVTTRKVPKCYDILVNLSW